MGLVSGIGNKIQFQHNSIQLQMIDNDTVNDDVSILIVYFIR